MVRPSLFVSELCNVRRNVPAKLSGLIGISRFGDGRDNKLIQKISNVRI